VNPTVASWLPTLIFVPLVAFALYRRVKRTFGRQPITPKRMVARMILLSILSVVFLAWMPTAKGFTAAAIGTSLGGILAVYGLRHTRYDVTSAGAGYTPNPWIGMVVTALFLGRFAARMFSVYEARALSPSAASSPSFQRSPLTLGIFFLMATYYVAYYAGVLRKVRDLDMAGPPG
jgi:predicted alpha/beta-fold hydrolase